MKMPNIYKYAITITLILVISITTVFAQEITGKRNLSYDNTLVYQNTYTYSQPSDIYITQVKGFEDKLANNPDSWVKLLYYYSITQLKLPDIPYNYLLGEGGEIYEGKQGGAGVTPNMKGGDNVVLIGYLSNKSSLTPRASEGLKDLVQSLSYKYGIKSSWKVVDLSIETSKESLSILNASNVNNLFSDSVSQTMNNVKWSDTEHLEYKASITSVEYPKEVTIGENFNVKVVIKNENDFPWFGDKNYIYISTKESKDSQFAINAVWDSFSKPGHIQTAFVRPGESVEVTFSMLPKSLPGDYKESFNIMKSEDLIFQSSDFDVEFKIVAGNKKLVQINSPEYGFVNIRECRWSSCNKLDVANDKEVFINTKEEEGWYEIEYGEGKTGWVYQKYIKKL